MPGLASSYAIIENDELRHRFQTYLEASEFIRAFSEIKAKVGCL